MNMTSNRFSKKIVTVFSLLAVLFLLTYLSGLTGIRLDVTRDQRYTLSQAAVQSVENFDNTVFIDVFLEGDLPAEFRKLKNETEQILLEFESKNPEIRVNFIDPKEENEEETLKNLQAMGLTPARVTTEEGNKVSQELVFPWALVNYNQKTVKVSLLKNTIGSSLEQRITNSVQHLEYAFADAFTKVAITEKKKIAVLKGNGELPDIEIADFLNALKDYYHLAPFTLEKADEDPQGTLDQLNEYDLTLLAKPTKAFTNTEKLVLDQYLINGGKGVWLLDQVQMEMDSLYQNQGEAIAVPRDLNLDDMLFKYGVRINPALVSDLNFTAIVLAVGSGNETQYSPAPWLYNPLVVSRNNHAINTNIEALRMQFCNPIDTLANGITKKVLLQSSPLSKPVGSPALISLEAVGTEPDKATFNNGDLPLGVLLEGSFTSVYNNRVLPASINNFKAVGAPSGLIVISDGDLIRNDIQQGMPMELGYDKWTNTFYGNKEFLLNCVNYLLEENGLINIRNKKVELAFLDTQKSYEEKTFWQFINIGVPAVLSLLAGLGFAWFRKRRYGR